jgi:hypothetical protein
MKMDVAAPITLSMLKSFHQKGHQVSAIAFSAAVHSIQFFAGDPIGAHICPEHRPLGHPQESP